MPRTTNAAVGKLIRVRSGDDLTPFVETANALVTEVCTASGYSDATLELIERWLSAHFYDVYKPRAGSESVNPGPAVRYEDIKVDLGLSVTKYGQQAMAVDYKHNLAAVNAGQQPGVVRPQMTLNWLGTALEDE